MDGTRAGAALAALVAVCALAACGDSRPAAPVAPSAPEAPPPMLDGLPLNALPSEVARARVTALAAARRSALRRLRGVGTPEAALDRALLSGRISRFHHRRLRGDLAAARAAVTRLSGARRTELASVLGTVDTLAAEGRLGPSRLRPVLLVLRRNTETWTRAPFPAPRERRRFGRDPAVFEYYPGHGMQLQQLASWGFANGLAHACLSARAGGRRGSCDERRLRQVLDRLAGLGARRGGFLAFEYYFQYGSGAPPWISGMAQATALQALARAGRALHSPRYTRIARQGLGAFETPPPVGVSVPADGGRRFTMYSFDPGQRILNGELQAVSGLRDAGVFARSKAARRLASSGDRAARRALAGFDTGAWSLYSARGREADLNYHRLTTEFLGDLCARFHHARYCRESKRFARYEREPPRIRIGKLRGLRARRATTLHFTLSKVSTVTVRVFSRRGALLLRRRFQLYRGRHELGWVPPARGRFRVRVDAQGPSGPTGAAARELKVVLPKPHKKKKQQRDSAKRSPRVDKPAR
jgi:D-glucuronyl C5-epimerase-like protein